ncbi:unnamed protein product [Mytilus edulis]|uniref:Uncharacterized protein n=1 Tax=Mytilus edulis TaxID=6550 RepID=A0A8S3PWJ1_MYTED|nr:unnamed protein product [Mytilus edulis]
MYDQPGSAAEHVCLPPDPDFQKTSGYDGGRMYGAEYESIFLVPMPRMKMYRVLPVERHVQLQFMIPDQTYKFVTMDLLFLSLISFNVVTFCVTGEKDVKRLLLNDPDVVQDRLNRMENMLVILNNTVKQQTTTNQQQATTIQLLQAEIRQLQSSKGGGMYDQPGSAAEYVCLPHNPDFEKTSGNDNGRMYGAEYQGTFLVPRMKMCHVQCVERWVQLPS